MDENFSFGYWLRRQRLARDLHQEALAAQLGVATVTLRKIEADARRPSLQLIARLAEVFALSPEERATLQRVARADLSPAALPLPERAPAADPRDIAAPVSAPNLPSGTVTFLFTDIAGSTRRWEQHPQTMPAALARHDAILRAAISAEAGEIFKTVGDAFCAAFADPRAALLAALNAQHQLAAEPWGDSGPLNVRMALHSGVAEARDNDYFGPPLNRVARLLSLAHGGQVLLAAPTAELLHDRLPPAVSLRDLGLQRLKDLARPERVYQLAAPGLPSSFPTLRGAVDIPHNLPTPPNPLIGREVELAAIQALLQRETVRLLTLLGPGGTGKTRLALQVAHEQLGRFPDGVWLVDLTPVRDPALVLPTIARTLGLRESHSQPLAEQLHTYLRERALLLLLDNLEQVIEAGPELAGLLGAAPDLRLLVTSREALRLVGEQVYAVPPLAVPAAGAIDPLSSPAAQLFIARARAARADFTVDGAGEGAILAICQRLDGLPLAIELAAARARLLPPQAIVERLGHPLELLTAGARDLPSRQQTLRTTIAWSYDLLADAEQALFRRLGVFVGGWDLAAAEAVGAYGLATLDLLGALIDKSLVRQTAEQDGAVRFSMLETIREYALERLAASGEKQATCERHAEYYLALAEAREPGLISVQEIAISAAWERDHDNLRAVLSWYHASSDTISLVRLTVAVWPFWLIRQHFREGNIWLSQALEGCALLPVGLSRRLLIATGWLAQILSEFTRARNYLEQALLLPGLPDAATDTAYAHFGLAAVCFGENNYDKGAEHCRVGIAIYRRLGNTWRTTTGLSLLAGFLKIQGDLDAAASTAREALALSRSIEADLSIAECCNTLGSIALARGDYSAAAPLLEEGYLIFTKHRIWHGLSDATIYLGHIAHAQGQYQRAATLLAECLTLRRNLGDRRGCIAPLISMVDAFREQGALARSYELITEALKLARDLGYQQGICWSLDALARTLSTFGYLEQAARLWGTEELLRETVGLPIWPDDQLVHERGIANARAQFDEVSFAAAWAAGRALSLDEAVAEALAWLSAQPMSSSLQPEGWEPSESR